VTTKGIYRDTIPRPEPQVGFCFVCLFILFIFIKLKDIKNNFVVIKTISLYRFSVGLGIIRRSGDVEGVRQSSGNWQRDDMNWTQSVLIPSLSPGALHTARGIVSVFPFLPSTFI
jgi:hypothetical protein